jgi:hypothetical protein
MIGSLSIQLPIVKGTLTLSGDFNAFDLIGDERALVFSLLDLMQDFEAKHAPAADLLPLTSTGERD